MNNLIWIQKLASLLLFPNSFLSLLSLSFSLPKPHAFLCVASIFRDSKHTSSFICWQFISRRGKVCLCFLSKKFHLQIYSWISLVWMSSWVYPLARNSWLSWKEKLENLLKKHRFLGKRKQMMSHLMSLSQPFFARGPMCVLTLLCW